MSLFTLTSAEVDETRTLISGIVERYQSAEDPAFLSEIGILAQDLPRRLRSFIHDFRYYEEGRGYCLIRGFPIDQQKIGPTPSHWAKGDGIEPTFEEEIFLMLTGTLLGDPIAWATQQDGALVHNIMPMRCHENAQLGFSSKEPLTWHVEDAFHEYRGDYLGMMCMRNPQETSTTIGSISDVTLDEEYLEVLFQPHYTILPDKSHMKKNNFKGQALAELDSSFSAMEKREREPDKVSVLFGDPKAPYVRLDPYFMDKPENPLAARALDSLIEQMEANLQDVVLGAGEVVFVDNFRAVHGRVPFQARYDGTDRWLKRINIARDLRKSRDARELVTCRKIL